MKTFQTYCENLNDQKELVNRIITRIYYATGIEPDKLIHLGVSEIVKILQDNDLISYDEIDLGRLAGMIKSTLGQTEQII